MFGRRKKQLDKTVWRGRDGNISCPGRKCTVQCDDQCPIWLNTNGVQELMKTKPKQAIPCFLKAVKIAPDFADAYCNLGAAFGMSNDYEQAYNAFSKAIELRKVYPEALRGLIVTEKNLGRYADALKHCDQLEQIMRTDLKPLRDEIKRAQIEATASEESWIALYRVLINYGQELGYINTKCSSFIPELLAQSDQTCARINQDIARFCMDNPGYNYAELTLVWAAFAGIGAVYHWNKDWNTLSQIGIFETLTKERGTEEMDEYVLDCIGLPHGSRKGKTFASNIKELAAFCINQLTLNGILEEEIVTVGTKAMFSFGMLLEMNRLGMIN